MSDLLAGASLVLSLVAILAVLALAREIGLREVSGPALLHPGGVPVGTRIASLEGANLAGETVGLSPSVGTIIVFALAGCAPCASVLAQIGSALTLGVDALIVSFRGTVEDAGAAVQQYSLDPRVVVPDVDGRAASLYGISRFPYAVRVSDHKVGAHGPVSSIAELDALAAGAGGSPSAAARSEPVSTMS